MNQEKKRLLKDVNSDISRSKGIYMAWAKMKNLNYHTMLILYLLMESESNTQKQICSEFGIPKQTVNNIVRALAADGYVEMQQDSRDRREKIIRLTDAGYAYADSCLGGLFEVEEMVMERMGKDAVNNLIRIVSNYSAILEEEITKSIRARQKGSGVDTVQ